VLGLNLKMGLGEIPVITLNLYCEEIEITGDYDVEEAYRQR